MAIKIVNGDSASSDEKISNKENIDESSDKKSLLVAYLLWLFGGLFGLHHIYLKRDRHAFVAWMTLGSYFGLGWIREVWRLPEYVSHYNMNSSEYLLWLGAQMQKYQKPPSSLVRHMGTIIVADVLGYLVLGAIPLDYLPSNTLPTLTAVFIPLGVAIGVHTVGNIGHQRGSLKWSLIGAYLTAPLYYLSVNSVFWTAMASYYCFNTYSKDWRKTHYKRTCDKSLSKRLLFLFLAACLYSSLWASWIFFNCTIIDKDDEEVKCRDAVKRFFNSPIFQEFTSVIKDLWNYGMHHGWSGFWKEVIEALDASGEANALKVLNVTDKASQEEITSSYRKLSKMWHPDRHKDEQEKAIASEKFMEIQSSYELLSRKKLKRVRRNKKERENPEEHLTKHRPSDEL